MADVEAAWVRDRVWTKAMRKTFTDVPGHYLQCACQGSITTYCQAGRHDRCHRAKPLRDSETWICYANHVLVLPELFKHPTNTSAVGPRRERYATVWLADRVCRWQCPCDCHQIGKQLNLFAIGRSP